MSLHRPGLRESNDMDRSVVFLTPSREITALFVINRLVDAGFMYDMYIQFNLAFQSSPEEGGMWIEDRR